MRNFEYFIIAYLIWKGSYNFNEVQKRMIDIIAYLIWKGSYNEKINKNCNR